MEKGSMRVGIAVAATLCLFWGWALSALASAANPTATGPHCKLRLVSEVASLEPGRNLDLGFLFDLEPHWHIYWINPGDSGEPPSVTWKLPRGFQAAGLEWPAPQRLVDGPLTDYGYQGRVLLIAPVRLPSAIKEPDVTLSADVRWVICSDVCIPARATVAVDLPVVHTAPHPDAQATDLFRVTRRTLPQPLPARWRVTAEDEGTLFRIRLSTGTRIRQASFFPLDFNQVENAKPQTSVPFSSGVELSVYKSDQLLKPIRQLRGVLVIEGRHAFQVTAPVKGG